MRLDEISQSISIVIPVFNEENRINSFINALPNFQNIEILVINDGSTDDTVKQIKASGKKTRIINLKRNLGYASALMIGLLKATGDIIMSLDVCIDYKPDDIRSLIHPLIAKDADIVIGIRETLPYYNFKSDKLHKIILFIVRKLLNNLWKVNIVDPLSELRAYRKEVINDLKYFTQTNPQIFLLLHAISSNCRIEEVTTTYQTKFFFRSRIYYITKSVKFLISTILKALSIRYFSTGRFTQLFDSILGKITLEPIKRWIFDKKTVWGIKEKVEISKSQIDYLIEKRTFPSVIYFSLKPEFSNLFSIKIKKDDHEIYQLIKALPKIDLHCHLGGCTRLEDLVKIASTYPKEKILHEKIREYFKKHKRKLSEVFKEKPIDIVREIGLTSGESYVDPSVFANLIQFLDSEKKIELLNNLYYINRKSNKSIPLLSDNKPNANFIGLGLETYLGLGNWGGSTMLQTPEALNMSIKCLCDFASNHNVKYLELRFNPLNYTRNGMNLKKVYKSIMAAINQYRHGTLINVIFIVGKPRSDSDSHMLDYKEKLIELVQFFLYVKNKYRVLDDLLPKLVGFDIAGLEDHFNRFTRYGLSDILTTTRDEIHRLFEKGFYITIHCGETKPKPNLNKQEREIWNKTILDSIQILGANRIGHGLNISENSYERIKRANITIEMCPSSNCQVSSYFQTPWALNNSKKHEFMNYPLRKYLDNGLKVCINTDDPAISKTNWTNELIVASELYKDYMSLEKIIKLIYNGIEGSFLSQREQDKLKKIFDDEILMVLGKYRYIL